MMFYKNINKMIIYKLHRHYAATKSYNVYKCLYIVNRLGLEIHFGDVFKHHIILYL